jgi:hypothetical protein
MTIALTVSPTTVTLPVDLRWTDELDWHPVRQSVERSLTGALIVDVAAAVPGRSITLEPENDSSAWMPRADVEQLQTWAAVPGQEMSLLLRGVTHTVMFRHHEGEALTAKPVLHYSDVDAADWYLVTLKLMKV